MKVGSKVSDGPKDCQISPNKRTVQVQVREKYARRGAGKTLFNRIPCAVSIIATNNGNNSWPLHSCNNREQ